MIIASESGRIADESRKVAIWTRRDSTDMRIITVITMLFLPGTFVAVAFPQSDWVSPLADEYFRRCLARASSTFSQQTPPR